MESDITEKIEARDKSSGSFPHDCTGCKNYICYDMSIDDYTNICTKYGWQIDDCDAYGLFGVLRSQTNCYETNGNI